jgi:hypothetical protein
MAKRYFSASAIEGQLISGVSEVASTIELNATTGFPSSYPYIVVVDNGRATEEVMLVTAAAGNILTVTRGYDSTTAYSHSTGASVQHAASAIDFREANHYINGPKTWGNLFDGS